MILQLVDSSGIGGIESHITNLTRALNALGHTTKIILLKRHNNNPWFEQLDRAGLDYQTLSGGFLNLRKAIQSDRPNIIHTHGYKAGILGRIASKICHIPVVSTFHAGERAKFPVSLYQTIDEWSSFLGGRIAVNKIIADKMPFKTQVIRNFILSKANDVKALKISQGSSCAGLTWRPTSFSSRVIKDVDTRVKPAHDGSENNQISTHNTVTQKPLAIGFVGRLSYEKGPDIFCEIANRVTPNIPFHIFGDGIMRAELEEHYKNRVIFHGVATNMSEVWPHIGLLLMPSRAEGLPMAALEALNEGIPVLASNVGALPDIIQPNINGWLHTYDDISAMASCIEAWSNFSTQTHNQMSQNCIEQVTKHFGSDEPLRQILDVYKKAGVKNL
jgi:glycosyltransferase involved in cell wall biosynthesis